MNKTVSESYILLEEILLYKLSPEEEELQNYLLPTLLSVPTLLFFRYPLSNLHNLPVS